MSELLEILRADGERLQERRATPTPPKPASRPDQIIAEGDRKRHAYRCAHPDADTVMVYGVQIGYLHAQVRMLCAEAEALSVVRDAQLDYLTVAIGDIAAELTAGFAYQPGEPEHITSAQHYEQTGDPGSPGCDEELELQEVWVHGADVTGLLSDAALEKVTAAVLAKIHALQAKGREQDEPQ